MKKMIALLMALVLMLAYVPAFAAVPSKTTTDNTQVKEFETVSDVEVADTFIIQVCNDPVPVVTEIDSIFTFVNETKEAPVNYFPAETKEAIREALSAQGAADVSDTVLEKMELNEFISIESIGYKPEYGNIRANFTFVTRYSVGQKVVAMLGIYTGKYDAQGNPIADWVVLDTEVQADGSLSVVISQDEMLRMENAEAVALAVLSEAQ